MPALVVLALEWLAYSQVRRRGEEVSTPWLSLASWSSIAAAILFFVPVIVNFFAEDILGVHVQACFDDYPDCSGGTNLFGLYVLIVLGGVSVGVLALIGWLVYLRQLLGRRRAHGDSASHPDPH